MALTTGDGASTEEPGKPDPHGFGANGSHPVRPEVNQQQLTKQTNMQTRIQTKIMFGLTTAAFLALSHANAADNYKIDPAHTSIGFSVRHMGVSNVKGHFDEFAGSMVLDNGSHLRRQRPRYRSKA